MATLKILRCKNCTAPLPAGTTTCPKCHAVNLVQSEVNPLQLPSNLTNDYIEFFKQQTDANPKDTNALFGMGLVYMGLKNYELAQRNFKLAVDQSPLDADVYYYFALSLFEGHNPMHLKNTITTRIEEWLHTATNRQAKRKYLILQMILRQGAFVANGLQVKGEQPVELFERICTMVPEADEIKELEEHIQITDQQTLAWLEQIKNGGYKPAEKRPTDVNEACLGLGMNTFLVADSVSLRDEYFMFSDNGDFEGGISALEDINKREEFFDFQYPPCEPELEKKPFYPLWQMIKVAIGYFILWIIALVVASEVPVGLHTYKIKKIDKETVTEVQEFFDNNIVISCEPAEEGKGNQFGLYKTPAEDLNTVLCYDGIERSWMGLAGVGLILLPIILFVIHWLVIIGSTAKKRREIAERNNEMKAWFNIATFRHKDRSTKYEYMEFCRHYLSPQSPCLSTSYDPVSLALKENNIDEKDMRGKILFVNYFEDEDMDGDPTTSPLITLRHIYYVIAIPQRDKLVMLKNRWDTMTDTMESCDSESVFYRNILSLNVSGDEIEIDLVGGTSTGIVLPSTKESIFSYQDSDPSNKMTYSATRTSDPHVFVKALETLIASH